jgi:NADH-quinone oxidoreductase subunit I
MWTVPPPPGLDPHAAEPKEVTAARRAADKPSAAGSPTSTETTDEQRGPQA